LTRKQHQALSKIEPSRRSNVLEMQDAQVQPIDAPPIVQYREARAVQCPGTTVIAHPQFLAASRQRRSPPLLGYNLHLGWAHPSDAEIACERPGRRPLVASRVE